MYNKQLQRTVTRRRGDAASAPFHYALAPRFTRQRAAAEVRRYTLLRTRSSCRPITCSREDEMLAFEVTVNGKRRYVAGHVDAQSVQLILWGSDGAAGINTFVAVPNDSPGGLATLSYAAERIAIGDELTIRIVDVEASDAPVERNDGEGSYQIEFGVSE